MIPKKPEIWLGTPQPARPKPRSAFAFRSTSSRRKCGKASIREAAQHVRCLIATRTFARLDRDKKMSKITHLEARISIITLGVADIHRAYRFYAEGLGFPTQHKPDDGWVGFKLNGICVCIYPYEQLKAENLARAIDAERALDRSIVPGVTLAYNTREKHQVEEVLELAKRAGGTIEKQPEDTFWGGYSGYFSDPDGHLWEVAWADCWKFDENGTLVL